MREWWWLPVSWGIRLQRLGHGVRQRLARRRVGWQLVAIVSAGSAAGAFMMMPVAQLLMVASGEQPSTGVHEAGDHRDLLVNVEPTDGPTGVSAAPNSQIWS